MAAVANIVLADALGTPVNHTFIPLGTDANGVWWFEDQTGSSAIGFGRISLQLVRPPIAAAGKNAGERTNRVKLGIHIPVLETTGTSDAGLTPPPTVAYVPRFTCEFIMSERALVQSRRDLRKYAQFLLADAQVVNMVELLQNVF